MATEQIPEQSTLLKQILTELRRQSVGADLWDMEDIAAYLDMSVSHVRQRVVAVSSFPRPVIIPAKDTGGTKRWRAKEVRTWQEKLKRG